MKSKLNNFLKLFLIIVVCFTLSPVKVWASTSPLDLTRGLGEPRETWNLATKGRYNFSGKAVGSDLYTDYLFTGVDYVRIWVTNHSNKKLLVKVFEKGTLWGFNYVSSVECEPNNNTVWRISSLSKSKKYYIQFYAPSEFSGYIETYK